jgi:hypothetical protein
MANRPAAEAFILHWLDQLAPGNSNVGVYRELFKGMDDAAFETFIRDLETGKRFLVFISPNFTAQPLTLENNLRIAKALGHEFFQQLWIGQKGDSPAYLTPVKYLVLDLPLRRASQLLIKKIRVPEHTKTVDLLTQQPTGDSRGSRVSYPELQVLAAMGLDDAIVELIKYRGGDRRGYAAYSGMLSKYGTANMKTLANYADGVASTRTLRTFLQAMHLKNTL